jgi:hypothetical protein
MERKNGSINLISGGDATLQAIDIVRQSAIDEGC